MSDIQHLENELEQSKRMMLTLSTKITSIENELAQLKSGQTVQQTTVQQTNVQQPTVQQTTMQQNAPRQPIMQPQVQQSVQNAHPQQNAPRQPIMQPQTQQPAMQPQSHQSVQNAQPQGQQSVQNAQPQGSIYRPDAKLSWNERYGKGSGYDPEAAREASREAAQKREIPTEEMLGKHIMGIAASVLIFISFILFATLMIPLLTDGMKITLMLAVSIGITAVGLIVWFRKNRESTFFLSLAACGVGAVYISLFMCNAYFHIIDDIILYVLILLWAGGVLFLSKYKQRLFEIIGEVGILVSIVFGCYSCVHNFDSGMLMILTIYSIIGVSAFLAFRIKDDLSLLIHGIFGLIDVAALTVSNYCIIEDNGLDSGVTISLGILAVACICIIVLYISKLNNFNMSFSPIFCMIASVFLSIDVYNMIGDKTIGWVIVLVLAIGLYIVIEYFKLRWEERFKSEDQKSPDSYSTMMELWQTLELGIIFVSIIKIDVLKDYVGAALIAIPLLIYGFMKSDRLSQIKGLVAFVILAFSVKMELASFTVLPLICFLIISIFMKVKKNEYSVAIKAVSYVTYLISASCCYLLFIDKFNLDSDTSVVVYIWIFGILNLVAKITPYGKSWVTHDEEKPFTIVTYVLNGLLMIISLIVVISARDEVLHFAASLGAIGLFCINSYNFIKDREPMPSIYVGLKFTVLIMVILTSYDAANYVLSISAFILAIAFIVLGFVMDIKSLRIYGLVVSMLCVIKLVMIDITYDNTMGHALSFFISGVLCFVISAVYSLAEKKLRESN